VISRPVHNRPGNVQNDQRRVGQLGTPDQRAFDRPGSVVQVIQPGGDVSPADFEIVFGNVRYVDLGTGDIPLLVGVSPAGNYTLEQLSAEVRVGLIVKLGQMKPVSN